MSVDEQYLRIRRSLEETLGMEEASYLMDRPVGGWSELVTNHTLDLKFDVIDERFRAIDERFRVVDARFVSLERHIDERIATLRHELGAQIDRQIGGLAWKLLPAVIAGMAAMGAVFAALTITVGS